MWICMNKLWYLLLSHYLTPFPFITSYSISPSLTLIILVFFLSIYSFNCYFNLSLFLQRYPHLSLSQPSLSLYLSFTFSSGCLYAFFSFSNKHYFFLNSKSTLLCLILISNQDWLGSVLRSLQVSFDNCISGLFNVLLQIL